MPHKWPSMAPQQTCQAESWIPGAEHSRQALPVSAVPQSQGTQLLCPFCTRWNSKNTEAGKHFKFGVFWDRGFWHYQGNMSWNWINYWKKFLHFWQNSRAEKSWTNHPVYGNTGMKWAGSSQPPHRPAWYLSFLRTIRQQGIISAAAHGKADSRLLQPS